MKDMTVTASELDMMWIVLLAAAGMEVLGGAVSNDGKYEFALDEIEKYGTLALLQMSNNATPPGEAWTIRGIIDQVFANLPDGHMSIADAVEYFKSQVEDNEHGKHFD